MITSITFLANLEVLIWNVALLITYILPPQAAPDPSPELYERGAPLLLRRPHPHRPQELHVRREAGPTPLLEVRSLKVLNSSCNGNIQGNTTKKVQKILINFQKLHAFSFGGASLIYCFGNLLNNKPGKTWRWAPSPWSGEGPGEGSEKWGGVGWRALVGIVGIVIRIEVASITCSTWYYAYVKVLVNIFKCVQHVFYCFSLIRTTVYWGSKLSEICRPFCFFLITLFLETYQPLKPEVVFW